jgi:hypothetical protein
MRVQKRSKTGICRWSFELSRCEIFAKYVGANDIIMSIFVGRQTGFFLIHLLIGIPYDSIGKLLLVSIGRFLQFHFD